ncbi:MAG: methylated-DNA--[protein]-cysteine S-methyltransferase [Promethearchaeota archaeon]
MEIQEVHIHQHGKGFQNYLKKKNEVVVSEENGTEKLNTTLKKIREIINDYFEGKNLDLYNTIQNLNIDLNLEGKFKSKFSLGVIQVLLKTRPGETTDYYTIARKIGTKAYRAVGNILRNNPLPLIIPCHRVIRKNGNLGGFSGAIGDCWETRLKKLLLRIEGASGFSGN